MARHRDPLTKDLFDWEPPKVSVGYSAEVTGRGPLDNRIARIIGETNEATLVGVVEDVAAGK